MRERHRRSRFGTERIELAIERLELVARNLRGRIVVEEGADRARLVRGREPVGLVVADRQPRERPLLGPRGAQPGDAAPCKRARASEDEVDLRRAVDDRAHGVTVTWSMLCTPFTRTNTRTGTPLARPLGSGIFSCVGVDVPL